MPLAAPSHHVIVTERPFGDEPDLADPGCLDDSQFDGNEQQPGRREPTGSENTGPHFEQLFENTCLAELRLGNDFIRDLKDASLNGRHSGLDSEALDRLKNPPRAQFTLESQPDL